MTEERDPMTTEQQQQPAPPAVGDPDAVVRQPRQVPVDFQAVLDRSGLHYAQENARLVGQLSLSQEEASVLRVMLDQAETERDDYRRQYEALLDQTDPAAKGDGHGGEG